jgi:ornithine cyclodeaminase/alanine dehydrogenase-like protein (mu-crystallin family)
MMPVSPSILYLDESDVRQTLSVSDALALAELGIRADAGGEVAGDKFYMQVGTAGFIKPFSGYLRGEELAFVKTFTFFPRNPERRGLPATSSMVLLFEATTGLPVCLMEGGWVTALKTGASSAITARYLARPGANTATIFGAGMLGRMHLRAMSQQLDLERVYVVDILPQAAEAYAAGLMSEVGFLVEPVLLAEREKAVRNSEIVFTVTTGDQPLLEREWLQPGAFVGRLGSHQEVALDVITEADKVVVDSWDYVRARIPELKTLAEAGRFAREHVHAEWPDIVAGRSPGRESAEEVIVYLALGIWGEYAAILPEVYRRAREMGLGQPLKRS